VSTAQNAVLSPDSGCTCFVAIRDAGHTDPYFKRQWRQLSLSENRASFDEMSNHYCLIEQEAEVSDWLDRTTNYQPFVFCQMSTTDCVALFTTCSRSYMAAVMHT
jgi:hypothetical protein